VTHRSTPLETFVLYQALGRRAAPAGAERDHRIRGRARQWASNSRSAVTGRRPRSRTAPSKFDFRARAEGVACWLAPPLRRRLSSPARAHLAAAIRWSMRSRNRSERAADVLDRDLPLRLRCRAGSSRIAPPRAVAIELQVGAGFDITWQPRLDSPLPGHPRCEDRTISLLYINQRSPQVVGRRPSCRERNDPLGSRSALS
jgi:hypothetical protein